MPGPLDLDAIEARANAATPGPWVAQNYDDAELDGNWPCVDRVGQPDSAKALAHIVLGSDDAEFIARAREDVPALISRIRGLEARSLSAELRVFRPVSSGDVHHGERYFTIEPHIVEGYSATEQVGRGYKVAGNPMMSAVTVYVEVEGQ
jgi:hypothetical protein